MDIASIATICTTIVATTAGVATIIANIRYLESENSRVLKEIAKDQREGFKVLSGDSKSIEKSLEIQTKILERIEGNTRN